jgi:hypothetical protein
MHVAMTAPEIDPESTTDGGFAFLDLAGGERQLVSPEELCARLTALIRSCEGCESVSVIEVYRLDVVDSKDGCNWSLAILLDPAGVAPEVYAMAYGSVLHTARASWNLAPEIRGQGPEPADA